MCNYTLHLLTTLHTRQRFTSLIAEAIVAQRPDIELRIHEGGGEGVWKLCGAEATGLLDDVIVIESKATGRFKVVDLQDSYSMAYWFSKSPLFRGAAIMMYHPPSVEERYKERAHLFSPGWFLDQDPDLTRSARIAVQSIRDRWEELDPRLFFRGTIHGETPNKDYLRGGKNIREVGLVLRDKYPDEVDISGFKDERRDWFFAAAQHQFVLTLPGHPWCYREFEMMSLGIPTITYRWTSYLYHQPIYYFPVENVPQDPIGFALDPEVGADAIITKFRQVRDNREAAESVGRRAQQWYDTYLTPQAIAKDMLAWFDIDHL